MNDTRTAEHPLTVQQRAMLEFIGTRVDDHYLNVEVFHLVGPLDLGAFKQAVASVVRRHDVLRSVYPGGKLVYQVLPASTALVDILCCVADGISTVAEAVAAGTEWASAPMRLDEQPPLRVWVGRIDPTNTVVVVGGHYLVFDAWSFVLFYEDLSAEYQLTRTSGDERPRPPQYDGIGLGLDVGELEGWSDLFDRPYRATRDLDARLVTSRGPCTVLHRPWQAVGGSIALAAKRYAVTPYVLGVAAMLRALSDVLHDPQVLVGTPYGGRTNADSANAIGFFATTLFVGADLDVVPETDALVRHVSDQLRQWYEGPRTQWQPILKRHAATDLYVAKFVMLPSRFAQPTFDLDGVSTERLRPLPAASIRRPIDVLAAYGRGEVTADLRYRPDVVDRDTAAHLLDRFFVRLAEIFELS